MERNTRTDQPVQRPSAVGAGVILLGVDSQGSVVAEAGASVTTPTYTVHGYDDRSESQSDIGYTAELKEPGVDWYVLGHYRAYSPMLMRFHSPDAASPFGRGGLNAYVYCLGNPVNRSDPSGEGWEDWLFVGIGIVASGIAMAMSGGTLGPAFAAALKLSADLAQGVTLGLFVVDLSSIATSIVYAKAVDDGNDALASKMALSTMVLGLAGLGGTLGVKYGPRTVKAFTKGKRYVSTPRVSEPTTLRAPLSSEPGNAPGLRGAFDPMSLAAQAGRALGTRSRADVIVNGPPGLLRHAAGNGIQRLATAAASPAAGRVLVARGMLSPELLARFPSGIDMSSQSAVIRARDYISQGLEGFGPLNRDVLSASGFDDATIMALNPSRPAPTQGPMTHPDFMRARVQNDIEREGEHVYYKFLREGNPSYLNVYRESLWRARTTNDWSQWNSPSDFHIGR